MQIGSCSSAAPSFPAADLMRLERQVAELVQQYDEQGNHRTGTINDNLSSEWLVRLARATGATVELDTFELDRVDVVDCGIEIDGRKVGGIPLFDHGFCNHGRLAGRFGLVGEDCDIALTEAAHSEMEGKPARATDLHPSHKAVVRLTKGERPGLVLANAPRFNEPSCIPHIQVSGVHAAWLKQQAAARASAVLSNQVTRQRCSASNVVATVPGTDPSLPPLVVSTPRSGWWSCASERGGGIACWIQALRSLSERRRGRSCVFAAFSGHELGLLGGRHFMRTHSHLAEKTHLWLHFGANLGAPGMDVKLQGRTLELIEWAARRLAAGGVPHKIGDPSARPRGEAILPDEAAIPYLAPISNSSVFHHSADRWPDAVDTAALARIAAAYAALAWDMAHSDPG